MNYKDYKQSRNSSWKILIACQTDSLPIDLNVVLQQLGVQAYTYQGNEKIINALGLTDAVQRTSGLTFYRGENPFILYDGTGSSQRIRFTIAHELGHLILGHVSPGEVTAVNREPNPQDNPIETAANRFAADLLAPVCVLWGLRLHDAAEIAQICNISLQSASFRAQRMEILYQRDKFLTHPLEQRVYELFQNYIKEWEGHR